MRKLFDSNEIKKVWVEEYKKQVMKQATLIRSNIRDWLRWEHDGRIYVGWKRACWPPLVNVYSRYRFEPLSTIEILRRKVRAWLDKR